MRRRRVRVALGVLLGGFVLLGGGLAWLALRPVDLSFLTPRVETALEPADGSLRVQVARTLLGFRLSRGLELRLLDARATDRQGEEVLRLPSVAVRVSALRLLEGHVVVTGLELDSPSARVVRLADGQLDVVLESSEASAEPRQWGRLLAELGAAQGPLGSLRRLRIRHADLHFEDRARGLAWAAQSVELQVERRPRGLAATVAAELDLDGSAGALEAELAWEEDARAARLEVRLDTIDLRPIVSGFLTPAERTGLPSLPLRGSIEARWALSPDAAPPEIRFDLAGALRAGPSAASGPQLTLKGRLAREDETGSLDLELRLGPVEAAHLGTWWPPGWAGETRSWIVENVSAGRVRSAQLQASARLTPGRAPPVEWLSLKGGLEAEELVVRYLAPLPEAEEIRTSATFDRERWDFTLRGGRVRDVAIRGGSVSILGLQEPAEPRLALDLQLDGPIATVVDILALPPLGLVPEAERGRAEGRAEGRLSLAVPLEDAGAGRIEVEAEARLHHAALEAPSPLPALSQGELRLSVDDDTLRIEGPAHLGGRPSQLAWTHHFADAQGIQRMELDGSLEAQPSRPPLSFELKAERDATSWLGSQARFELGDGPPSSADYSMRPEGRVLSLRSPDLGALLGALGVSDHLSGGRLRLDAAASAPDAPLAGHFELTDFILAQTAVLGALVEALHLDGLPATDRLSWQSASGDFRELPDGLEIQDATIAGELLVFTLEGRVTPGPEGLQLRGAAVPLRRVNSLVGGIPVFGPLVTGESEGLVSAHYRVTGTLADPVVRVDPWSSLVPGPIRGLLRAGGAVGRAGAEALHR